MHADDDGAPSEVEYLPTSQSKQDAAEFEPELVENEPPGHRVQLNSSLIPEPD